MISETTFCHQHSSVWRILAPTCDLFVRKLNDTECDRFANPIISATTTQRRAFINELGFNLFSNAVLDRKGGFASTPSVEEIRRATDSARKVISRIKDDRADCDADPDSSELADASEQYRRLWNNLTRTVSTDRVVMRPTFPGCGIIDTCQGDVLIPRTLFEVKAGDRGVRSIDIRQLITYATLNYIAGSYEISSVGLINPRTGIWFQMSLDEVCFEVSGKSTSDMLSEVASVLSSGDISR